jgi:hypothetical protein
LRNINHSAIELGVLTILVSRSKGVSEMDTDVILLRVSRRAVKKIAITGVGGCVAVTGFTNAVSGISALLAPRLTSFRWSAAIKAIA